MTKSNIQNELDQNIPKGVIETREQAGRTLSYLATWYVIDRLNQVLGQGNWGYQIKELVKVFEGTIQQSSGEVFTTSYTAQVALFATVEGKTVIFTEVGYGDGTDRKSQGKAHELATKEAVSDALKRGAKNLGRSMGLALYDKTQEFVGNNNKTEIRTVTPVEVQATTAVVETNKPKEIQSSSGAEKSSKQNNVSTTTQPTSNGSKSLTPKLTGNTRNTEPSEERAYNNSPIRAIIAETFKILEAQKKITKDTFKEKYLKGAGLSTLSDLALQFIYNSLKTDFPELGL